MQLAFAFVDEPEFQPSGLVDALAYDLALQNTRAVLMRQALEEIYAVLRTEHLHTTALLTAKEALTQDDKYKALARR